MFRSDAQLTSQILNRMSHYLTALHTWVYEFAIIQRQLPDKIQKNQSVDIARN